MRRDVARLGPGQGSSWPLAERVKTPTSRRVRDLERAQDKASATLKSAVPTPMPRASEPAATAVRTGRPRRTRAP